MAGPIRISILANANQAVSAFNRAGDAGKSLGNRIGSVSGVLKTALVGAGIYKGVELLTSKLTEANDAVQLQEQLAAQTAAAIKSTGGAANVAATQVATLSDTLERKSLIDAEQIQAGQNMLLTFTNVQNVAGKGNAIFTRATRTFTDMATALKSGTTAEAQRLGKALNDPIKGVTALSKVGVTFTEQQREQIKTLTESGNRMAAQKIILKELSKEFGGSAAAAASTSAGSFKRLRDAVDGVFESVVKTALPVLADVADYLVAEIPKGVAAAQPAIDAVRGAFDSLRTTLEPVTTFLRENPVVLKGAAAALGIAAGAALLLAGAFAAVSLATSPITLAVVAIAAVGGAMAYAYKNSEQFRAIVSQVGQVITGTVLPALQQFGGYVQSTVVPAVVRVAQAVASNLQPILTQMVGTFRGQVAPAIRDAAARFQEWWPSIRRAATSAAELIARASVLTSTIAGKVIPAVTRIAGVILANAIPAFVNFIGRIGTTISTAVRFGGAVIDAAAKVAQFARRVGEKVGDVVRFFTGLPGQITGAIGNVGSLLYNAGASIIQGLLNGIESKIGAVKSKLSQLTNLIPKLKGPPERDRVLLRQAGIDIMTGLVAGFIQGSAGVTASLEALTQHIERSLDKTVKRVDAKYDRLAKSLKKNLDGKELKAALERNEKARDRANTKAERDATRTQRAIMKATKDLRAQIVANGAAQDTANQKLNDAVGLLQQMRDEATNYAAGIRDAVAATGSLSTLGQGDGYGSVEQLISLRTAALSRANQFTEVINKLMAAGLNTRDLQDLISQGAENGLAVAQALLDGGPAVIGQMNTLSAGLVTAGQQLGDSVAATLYGAGIRAQQSLVNGLQADVDALVRTAQDLGTQVANAIAQGLAAGSANVWHVAGKTADGTTKKVKDKWQIASPSRVFRALAENVTQGLAIGLDDTYVQRQGTQLASSLVKGFGTPALDAYMSTSGADAAANEPIRITLTAEALDALSRGRQVQADLDAYHAAGGRVRAS